MSLRSLFCLMHCGIANSFYGGMYTVYIRHIFAGSARDALKVHGQRCPSRPSKAIYICLVRFGRNIIHINKFDACLYAPDGIHSYQDNFYIKPYAFHLNLVRLQVWSRCHSSSRNCIWSIACHRFSSNQLRLGVLIQVV